MTPSPTLTGPHDTAELPAIVAGAVTVVVERRAHPGREGDLADGVRTLADAATRAPGSLGAGVLAAGENGTWHVILRFKDAASLRAWERSAARADALRRVEPATADVRVVSAAGEEAWFAANDVPNEGRLARGVRDTLWGLPVAAALAPVGGALWGAWPLGARAAIGTAAGTTLYATVIAPLRRRRRAAVVRRTPLA
jgi:hypothetical protein